MTASIGFVIAFLVGLTGVGAGSLTTPILILLFRQGAPEAVGTTLLFSLVIKILVAPMYLRRRQVNGRALGALCLGGVPGVVIGTVALAYLNVHRYERSILLMVGIMIAAMALYNLYRAVWRGTERGARDRIGWLPWMAAVIGAEAGLSSAGTGALGSLVLLNWTKLSPAEVVGTDLCFGLAVSIVGGSWHFSTGGYTPSLLLGLVLGGIPGVIAGAMLSSLLTARPLRVLLSILLSTLGLQLCFRALFR
jgi:uncharacterized membrane protein YfcA